MPQTFYPTNIGFLPTGAAGTLHVSTIVMGRFTSGAGTHYEGVGFGQGGRPDYAQIVQINLTDRAGDGTLTQKAQININVDDVVALRETYTKVPEVLSMKLQHTLICSNGLTSGMMILGSQPYAIT